MPSKASQLEKALERKCVDHALGFGWLSVKLDKAERAWPDRQFIGPSGRHFFVELKRPGQKPRPQQAHRIDRLNTLGHDVYVLDTFDDFIAVFNNYL